MAYNLRLQISCSDRKGLISAISSFIAMHDGNILSADQYESETGGFGGGTFFMRLEIEGHGFGLARDEFDGAFAPLARRHGMEWSVSYTDAPPRVAILVSRYGHCLTDLLWRWETGELDAEIPLVVSNHPDLAPRVEAYGIPFHHLPLTKAAKAEQEARMLGLLTENDVDLVVLARYMQILSPQFVDAYPHAIVNIHHSFLAAFVGADPYGRAHDRGVKTIGATAHYVTEELDAGPIIHQRTSPTSPTATPLKTSCASVARSNGGSSPAPSGGTSRTGCWSTAIARWCSSNDAIVARPSPQQGPSLRRCYRAPISLSGRRE